MTLLEEFVRVYQVPPAMQPYLHLVVDEREMELVVQMNGRAMTVDQVADMMEMSPQDAEAFLRRAYSRGIVDKHAEDDVATYSAATFYRRVDPMAMYENWGDIPADARDAVVVWQLQEFINLWLPVVEEMKEDPDVYHKIPNRDVLLLEEALRYVGELSEALAHAHAARVLHRDVKPENVLFGNDGAPLLTDFGVARILTRTGEVASTMTLSSLKGSQAGSAAS